MAVFTLCRPSFRVPAGRIEFTETQKWIVPDGVYVVDLFLVGGGGKGGWAYSSDYSAVPYGGGGGGGYTKTYLNVPVTPGSEINIVVGRGGGRKGPGISTTNGEPSSFGEYTAQGGKAGDIGTADNYSATGGKGGDGGSGGGGGGGSIFYNGAWYSLNSGEGGIDGADGVNPGIFDGHRNIYGGAKGKGQGTTTREFGEPDGKLYSSGGSYTASQVQNTGAGGKGGTSAGSSGYDGDNGIVIVRWKAQ